MNGNLNGERHKGMRGGGGYEGEGGRYERGVACAGGGLGLKSVSLSITGRFNRVAKRLDLCL